MARHLEDVMSMATTTHFDVSYLFHVVFLALFACCVLSALLLSCADGASDDKANTGTSTGGGGCGGAGCGGGCG
ncbi:hypothetical protein AALP_AA3G208400 [Arabis alpina]|uniref:Uncharacterized protein n=1 Tax=Arabis alpina TaxID=50452 RepID=A0A087HAL1_ARAAL|nr:hypothetical protein AALP_AA3G208400 [Arabis alpina]